MKVLIEFQIEHKTMIIAIDFMHGRTLEKRLICFKFFCVLFNQEFHPNKRNQFRSDLNQYNQNKNVPQSSSAQNQNFRQFESRQNQPSRKAETYVTFGNKTNVNNF